MPSAEQQERTTEYLAPHTPIEEAIVAEWKKVLLVEKISVHDNFFDLGGHSLLATRVIAKIRASTGVNIPIPVLFESPTVAGLAVWIETKGGEAKSEDDRPLVANPANPDGSRVVPQSFAQQRLWFSEVAAGSALYIIIGNLPFQESIDREALQRALTELARRHESLRTTFATREGEPIQVVAPLSPVPLDVEDLRELPPLQRRDALRRLRQAEAARPIDLARGPVVRFKLVILEDNRQILLFAMHHIVTDGWSLGVMRREIRVLYDAFRAGHASPLPEPALQYADFAIWQRNWLEGEVLEEQLNFWRERLAGAARLELPTDRPRPSTPSYHSSHVSVEIAESVARGLRKLALEEEATLFMVLLAAFQYVLGQNAGQDDVVVGTPIANRTRAELENIIGFFVNTLVMRTDLSGGATFRQLLQRVRRACLEAYAHQDLPFDRLVEELAPQRELNIQPLFQVLFVLQNTPDAGSMQHRRTQAAPAAPDIAGLIFYDLTLSVTESTAGLQGELHFNTDLFDRETAERFARHFRTLLENIVEDPDRSLSSLSIIPEAEQRQVLSWASPSPEAVPERCMHTLFEEVVDRHPDRVAVVFEERRLTYHELDGRANRLAHRLIAMGVRPETTVGVYLERGPEAIVALLAILKAGGVYLPLNPELPPERLSWILEDAGPIIILTLENLRSSVPSGQATMLALDAIDDEVRGQSDCRPTNGATPRHLAYVIYTSGSTGRPKGVMIEHRSLSHVIFSQVPLFGITPESRVLSTIALSFDASLGEIFRTLLAGATLYLARREQLLPGPDLIRLLRENRITIATLVPSVLAALPDDEALPELATLTVGGEALPAKLALRWGEGRRMLNGYGPTECTIGATLASDWQAARHPRLAIRSRRCAPACSALTCSYCPWA